MEEKDGMGSLKVEARWFLLRLPTVEVTKAVVLSDLPFACHAQVLEDVSESLIPQHLHV